MNYYEHHLGDYDGATAHLTWLEDCAYRRLICLYYRNESPIPADIKQACRLVRASTKQEREAVQQVLSEFFELQADGWHHGRCDEEVSRYREKSEKARANVMRRWSGRNADALPTTNDGNTGVHTAVSDPNDAGNTPRARPQTPDTRHQTQTPEPSVCNPADPGQRTPAEIHILTKIPMRIDWIPNPEILSGVLFRAGKPATLLTPAALANFREYYSQESAVYTETQWCQKLLASAQKFIALNPPSANTDTRSAYEILKAGLADSEQQA